MIGDIVILDNDRYVYVGHAGANSWYEKCVPRSVLAVGRYDKPTWCLLGNLFCLLFFTHLFAFFWWSLSFVEQSF